MSTLRVQQLTFGVGLTVSGAAGLVLAFPPFGLWPLIFVSFVPLAVAQHRFLPPRWSGAAPAIGVTVFLGSQVWGALRPDQRWFLLLLAPLLWAAGELETRVQAATDYRHLWWSGPAFWTAGLFLVD